MALSIPSDPPVFPGNIRKRTVLHARLIPLMFKKTNLQFYQALMMTQTVLIVAVCRTPFTYELSQMTMLSMGSRSLVDRAPTQCSEGHLFDSCQGLRFFFFFPGLCHVDQFTFHISLLSLKLPILSFTYQYSQ